MPSCKDCQGICCKHVAIQLDTPEDLDDFEDIKWYVAHKNIRVWIDSENDWYVEFITPCKFLKADFMCGYYEGRPKICRSYSEETCVGPKNDHEAKVFFESIHDVEDWIMKHNIK